MIAFGFLSAFRANEPGIAQVLTCTKFRAHFLRRFRSEPDRFPDIGLPRLQLANVLVDLVSSRSGSFGDFPATLVERLDLRLGLDDFPIESVERHGAESSECICVHVDFPFALSRVELAVFTYRRHGEHLDHGLAPARQR